MGKKLYVGNLSYNVSSSDLEQLFSQYGSVQRRRSSPIARRAGARASVSSRWAARGEANAAIDGLNEHEHDGRRLTVNEAKPREARTTGISGGGSGRGPSSYGGRRY